MNILFFVPFFICSSFTRNIFGWLKREIVVSNLVRYSAFSDREPTYYGIYGVEYNGINTPGVRSHSISVLINNETLFLFGGRSFFRRKFDVDSHYDTSIFVNDVWFYNISSNLWKWNGKGYDGKSLSLVNSRYGKMGEYHRNNIPGGRGLVNGLIQISENELLLFGGSAYDYRNNPDQAMNDLWIFNIEYNIWKWIGGSEFGYNTGRYGEKEVFRKYYLPSARLGGWSCKLSSNLLLTFGGGWNGTFKEDLNIDKLKNDLWIINYVDLTFCWMKGSKESNQQGFYGTKGKFDKKNHPGSRMQHVGWITNEEQIFFFSGMGIGMNISQTYAYLNDLWMYNYTNNEFMWISGTVDGSWEPNSPNGRAGSCGVLFKSVFHVFGGFINEYIDTVNDLWSFDVLKQTWIRKYGHYRFLESKNNFNSVGSRESAVCWKINSYFYIFSGVSLCSYVELKQNDIWYLNFSDEYNVFLLLMIFAISFITFVVVLFCLLLCVLLGVRWKKKILLCMKKRKEERDAQVHYVDKVTKRYNGSSSLNSTKEEKDPILRNYNCKIEVEDLLYTKSIRNVIGEKALNGGAQACVYDIKCKIGNTPKVLKKYDESKYSIGSVRKEFGICLRLNHENVVKLSFWTSEPLGIVLQKYQEITSMERMSWPLKKQVKVLLSIAQGMEYIHSRNVIHYDLKWGNIMMDGSNPVIIDFGLSKNILTNSIDKKLRGTHWYVDPVYFLQMNTVIGSEDVYSFSMLIYTTFCCEFRSIRNESLYYDGAKGAEEYVKDIEKDVNRMDEFLKLRPPIPPIPQPEIIKLMKKCWSLCPKDRPTFTEVVQTLEKIHGSINTK